MSSDSKTVLCPGGYLNAADMYTTRGKISVNNVPGTTEATINRISGITQPICTTLGTTSTTINKNYSAGGSTTGDNTKPYVTPYCTTGIQEIQTFNTILSDGTNAVTGVLYRCSGDTEFSGFTGDIRSPGQGCGNTPAYNKKVYSSCGDNQVIQNITVELLSDGTWKDVTSIQCVSQDGSGTPSSTEGIVSTEGTKTQNADGTSSDTSDEGLQGNTWLILLVIAAVVVLIFILIAIFM